MNEYTLIAGSKFETIPGYVIAETGVYEEADLVPVATEDNPTVPVGSFLCSNIMLEYSIPEESATTVLTKYSFRNRFTNSEKYRCDAFNVSFETNSNISEELKSVIRSGLKDFEASEEIDLLNPDIHRMLQLYEVLGLLDAPGRALEIGAIK